MDMKLFLRCIPKGTEFAAIVPNVNSKPHCISTQIKWLRPERGWIKLNTDGEVNSALGRAGGGGILRDCEGNWIGGIARFLGNCYSLMAELWAFKDGLSLAKNLGYFSICIEVDAEMIVLLLNCTSSVNLIMEPLLFDRGTFC